MRRCSELDGGTIAASRHQAADWKRLPDSDRFEAWYDSTLTDRESKLATYRSAGLDDGELPPLPEFLANSEQIVHDYERDISPLPSIPPRLLDDAIAMGWKVSD